MSFHTGEVKVMCRAGAALAMADILEVTAAHLFSHIIYALGEPPCATFGGAQIGPTITSTRVLASPNARDFEGLRGGFSAALAIAKVLVAIPVAEALARSFGTCHPTLCAAFGLQEDPVITEAKGRGDIAHGVDSDGARQTRRLRTRAAGAWFDECQGIVATGFRTGV